MNEHIWTRRWTRAALLGLAIALVLSGWGPDVAGTASARGRISVQAVETFQNTALIAIADNTTSAPSSIVVSGFETPIADVEVSLNAFTHPQASDVDVLLVGPAGQTALVMSDVGGAANNDNPTLDDQDPDQLPQGDLESGIFQPTNYDFGPDADSFAPNPLIPSPLPSGSALAVFNGTEANGTWTLFVDDDDDDPDPAPSGSFAAGWSLRITTANGVPTAGGETFQAQAGKPLTVPADGVLGNDSDPDGDPLEAILAGPPRQGTLALQADGGFTYTPKKKAKGKDSFAYLAQDPSGLNALATVDIQIKKKGKGGKKRKR